MSKISNKKVFKAYKRNHFSLDFKKSGPQKQLVYVLRFPISYKNSQLISRRVDFSSYFDWMGQVREYSLKPIQSKILKFTKDGRWGLATNSVKLKILDLLSSDDVLEVRLWLDKISGHDNIYHLSFDWLRFLKTNSYERVALSSLIATCVKITGHGEAILAKPPLFLRDFFSGMRPESKEKKPLKEYKASLISMDFGECIVDYRRKPRPVFENEFQTSLENSNLIGNIYFANYAKWINATKDFFLYRNKPDIFNRSKIAGEFITFECSISHIREAMPFDKILVKMYVSELYERTVVLRHEVFKMFSKEEVKLATAIQKIAFVKHTGLIPSAQKIPKEILSYFLK